MNQFKTIPIEIFRETLLKINRDTIRSMCSTNRYIQNICNDEIFWRDYYIMNIEPIEEMYTIYKEYVDKNVISWKQIVLTNGKYIELLNDDTEETNLIHITPESTLEQIKEEIGKVLNINKREIGYEINLVPLVTGTKYGIREVHESNNYYEFESDIPIENSLKAPIYQIYQMYEDGRRRDTLFDRIKLVRIRLKMGLLRGNTKYTISFYVSGE